MRDLSNVSLLDILPPSLTTDPTVMAAAAAIDAEMLKVTQAIDLLVLEYNVDRLDDVWLNELALQLRVDFYDITLPIEQRRQLIKQSTALKRRKGTVAAVEELITTIFGDGKVEEWWQYGGDPHHFRVRTSNSSASAEKAQEFVQALNAVKRLSSVLDSVLLNVTDELSMYYGGFLHMGKRITIGG